MLIVMGMMMLLGFDRKDTPADRFGRAFFLVLLVAGAAAWLSAIVFLFISLDIALLLYLCVMAVGLLLLLLGLLNST